MHPWLCYAFLVMTCYVQGGDVTCQKTTQNISVQADGTVYLPCTFNYSGKRPELVKVSWQTQVINNTGVVHAENSTGFRADTQDQSFRNHTGMSPKWIKEGNATLCLSQVLPQYSGTFHCLVWASQLSQECATVELTVSSAAGMHYMVRSLWLALPVLLALLSPTPHIDK